jgi:hypothetical protein
VDKAYVMVNGTFDFVAEFESYRAQVKGPLNLARFDRWADSFKYLQAMGELADAWRRSPISPLPSHPSSPISPLSRRIISPPIISPPISSLPTPPRLVQV